MTVKEVCVKVSSVIESLDTAGLSCSDEEKTESVCVGYFHIYGEENYLLTYAEKNDDQQVTTELKYENGTVTVKRYGSIESNMTFKEGTKDVSVYKIPPYSFDAEIFTKKIRASLSECGGNIDLYYNMKIGGADKNVIMKIEC